MAPSTGIPESVPNFRSTFPDMREGVRRFPRVFPDIREGAKSFLGAFRDTREPARKFPDGVRDVRERARKFPGAFPDMGKRVRNVPEAFSDIVPRAHDRTDIKQHIAELSRNDTPGFRRPKKRRDHRTLPRCTVRRRENWLAVCLHATGFRHTNTTSSAFSAERLSLPP